MLNIISRVRWRIVPLYFSTIETAPFLSKNLFHLITACLAIRALFSPITLFYATSDWVKKWTKTFSVNLIESMHYILNYNTSLELFIFLKKMSNGNTRTSQDKYEWTKTKLIANSRYAATAIKGKMGFASKYRNERKSKIKPYSTLEPEKRRRKDGTKLELLWD